jgi:hypothetical protein
MQYKFNLAGDAGPNNYVACNFWVYIPAARGWEATAHPATYRFFEPGGPTVGTFTVDQLNVSGWHLIADLAGSPWSPVGGELDMKVTDYVKPATYYGHLEGVAAAAVKADQCVYSNDVPNGQGAWHVIYVP